MKIGEMVEQVARQAEAEGGVKFLTRAGVSDAVPVAEALGYDPNWQPKPFPEGWRLFPDDEKTEANAGPGPAAPADREMVPQPAVEAPTWQPPGADPWWRPAPRTDGSLFQDPDFSLPTAAGPLSFRLFYDTNNAGQDSEWGFGHRASFPLRLNTDGTTVTVMHDDGSARQYRKVGAAFQVVGAKNGDSLAQNGDGSWDETYGATGFRYHFPAGSFVSIAYRATPEDMRLTYNYAPNQRLSSVVEPAGRRVTLAYNADGKVQTIEDWGNRGLVVLTYVGGDLTEQWGQTGCVTRYRHDTNHRMTSITDPEGFTTSYTYDYAGRVLTRSVAGNLGRYTYVRDGAVLNTGYTDPLGRTWTHLTSGGYPVGQIDPLGNRETYIYQNDRPAAFINALGCVTSYTWDSNGFQVGEQDALGNRWTQTWDSLGNLLTQQDPLGFVTTYSYGASPALRQLQGITDALGNRTTFGYLANGLPQFGQDAVGNLTTYVWDSLGLLVAIVNALGYRRTYLYDIVGNRTGEVDPLGNQWTYSHDALGRVIGVQNPLGYRSTTLYDARGLVQAEIDALGNRTSYQWNAYGSQTLLVNALGYRTTTVYDAANEAIATVDALGYRTTSIYDAAGRFQAQLDARGYVTTTVYDVAGQPVAEVDALGYRHTTVFDAVGRAVAEVDPLGNRSTTQYDARGLITGEIDALNSRATFSYDAIRQRTTVQDARGNVVTSVYDPTGKQIAEIDALGYRTSFVYDPAGQALATQDALGNRHSALYDPAGRVQATLDPLGARLTAIYDAAGRQIAAIDALNNRTTTLYDAADRVIAQQDSRSYLTSFVYDAVGQRLAVVAANGGRTTSIYDGRGSVIVTEDPLGAPTTQQYDPVGNQSLRIDPANHVATYTVDGLNRRTGTLYPDGTRVTATFDAAGEQISLEDVTGATSYHYDAAGRTRAVVAPVVGGTARFAVTYDYDAVGNRTLLVDPSGGRTTYSYDVRNAVTTIVNPSGERTTLVYDALEREQRKTLGNGMTVAHTFDAAGRETVLENRAASGAALAVYTASYDAVGNRLGVLELDGVQATYGYDASYQLVNEQRGGANAYNTTYLYDGAGNRLLKNDGGALTSYSYNSANELVLVTPPTGQPTTVSWDALGNMLEENAGGARTTYTWDYENRLTRVATSGGVETYAYAADGRRRQRVTSGETANFLWDGESIVQERDRPLALFAQYTDLAGMWGGLVSEWRSGVSSFYGFDVQGHARALISAAGGITDSYSYKAFGEELAISGSTVNPYRYGGSLGYYRDTATRQYIRARYLSTQLARWLSRDPLGFRAGDPNLYRYVENRATGVLDPSGLAKKCIDWWRFHECSRRCNEGSAKKDPGFRPCPSAAEVQRIARICKWDSDNVKKGYQDWPAYPDGPSSHPVPQATTQDCCWTCKLPLASPPAQFEAAVVVTGCTIFNDSFKKLPPIYQHCIWLHEQRRRKMCYTDCTSELPMGPDVRQTLTCVAEALRKCGRPVPKECQPPK